MQIPHEIGRKIFLCFSWFVSQQIGICVFVRRFRLAHFLFLKEGFMNNKPKTPEEVDLFLDEERLFKLKLCIESQGTALRVLLDEDAYKIFQLFNDYTKELVRLESKISFQKGYNKAKNESISSD